MQTGRVTAENVSLTNCDREQIHIPNSIQSHGIIFILNPTDFTILQVSENVQSWLDYNLEDILNQPLSELLVASQIEAITQCLAEDFEHANPLKISLTIEQEERYFDGIVHQHQDLVILELEPTEELNYINFTKFYHLVNGCVLKLQKTTSLLDTCNVVVNEVRKLTGFERVMIYRFNHDGSGNVIAENKIENIEPYLNLRYPASDIPKPARQLYLQNWLRIIADVNYQPVPITPAVNPLTGESVDLSFASLRSVSPIHIEYLQNMGVTASMSISIIRNQQLWGLIACHNSQPKLVPYEVRTACEFLGKILSAELLEKQENEELDYQIKLQEIQQELVGSISEVDNFIEGLLQKQAKLLEMVDSTGVVICSQDKFTLIGQVPDEDEIKSLLIWVENQTEENIFYTDRLPHLYPPSAKYKHIASGLLALSISKVNHDYILWFRPEVIQTVEWGGNPEKQVENLPNGEIRIHPRKSFQLWEETVRNTSLPWKKIELNAAAELRSNIISIVLKKADELAKINLELERSNNELDSFAYIASHDLKEPLRGIHNYSSFLIEDYAEILDGEGISKLETLIRLTQRMEDLIDSLLHFSRLGRSELSMEPTDLNELLEGVIDIIKVSQGENQFEINIPHTLPTITCDRIQATELFTNLFSNALKYNQQSQKTVEVGFIDILPEDSPYTNQRLRLSNQLILYVKDNGIGIPDKHHDSIFRIFKRLHGRKDYGGGTGAGLTIAKKIVERHGGEIWLESSVGVGTTFYFSLPV